MNASLGARVSADELRSAYDLRAKRFDEKTVKAASVKALDMKREAEEHPIGYQRTGAAAAD